MIPFRDLIIDGNKGVGIADILGKWAYALRASPPNKRWLRIAEKAKNKLSQLEDDVVVDIVGIGDIPYFPFQKNSVGHDFVSPLKFSIVCFRNFPLSCLFSNTVNQVGYIYTIEY